MGGIDPAQPIQSVGIVRDLGNIFLELAGGIRVILCVEQGRPLNQMRFGHGRVELQDLCGITDRCLNIAGAQAHLCKRKIGRVQAGVDAHRSDDFSFSLPHISCLQVGDAEEIMAHGVCGPCLHRGLQGRGGFLDLALGQQNSPFDYLSL